VSISTLSLLAEHSTKDSFLLGLAAEMSARLNLRGLGSSHELARHPDETGTEDACDERRTVAGTGADIRRPKRISARDVRELGRGYDAIASAILRN
jgi:hypothetical protein